MLACDGTNSVLFETNSGSVNEFTYAPYGHRSEELPGSTRLGCNGQLKEEQTGCYLLGNGYRAFSPLLMRFHSPDSWSPFGDGGLNSYSYTMGDPVNHIDSTGHVRWGALLALLMPTGGVSKPTSGSRGVSFPAAASSTAGRTASTADPLAGFTITSGEPITRAGAALLQPVNISRPGAVMQGRGGAPVQAGGASNSMPGPSRGGSQQRRVHFGPDVPTSPPVHKSPAAPKTSVEPAVQKTPKPLTEQQFKSLGHASRMKYLDRGGVDPTQKGFHGAAKKKMIDVRNPSAKYSEDNY